jgi:uncharacterized protein YqeY
MTRKDMTIAQLQADLNSSLKAGKAERVSTLRMLMAAIRNAAIAKYGAAWEASLTEADIADGVKKQIKAHNESITAFGNAGRAELVKKEKDELTILSEFAPKEMSDDELRTILTPIAASGEKNFGLLMKMAMGELKGKADGGRVSAMLTQLLSSK